MIKTRIYIVLLLCFSVSVTAQEDVKKVSFDKLVDDFKSYNANWEVDTGKITESSLFKREYIDISVSNDPLYFEVDTLVIENPFFKDDIEDWDDNYLNFPVSYSVIFEDRLVSLFDNGMFVCHNLNNFERDKDFEKKLNTKKFRHQWVLDGTLYARSKSKLFGGLYQWNGKEWEKSQVKLPVKKQPVLFNDEDFIVFADCRGEFGGTIYFYDKATHETYYAQSTCVTTVYKNKDIYHVVVSLGHGPGRAEIKLIENPRALAKAKKSQIGTNAIKETPGYNDTSLAIEKHIELWGIQFFSSFENRDRRLYMAHVYEITFLAELEGSQVRVVNPLFNKDKYTHRPITRTYGDYVIINLDYYGVALDREVSVMIIKGNEITLLDWNEKHDH